MFHFGNSITTFDPKTGKPKTQKVGPALLELLGTFKKTTEDIYFLDDLDQKKEKENERREKYAKELGDRENFIKEKWKESQKRYNTYSEIAMLANYKLESGLKAPFDFEDMYSEEEKQYRNSVRNEVNKCETKEQLKGLGNLEEALYNESYQDYENKLLILEKDKKKEKERNEEFDREWERAYDNRIGKKPSDVQKGFDNGTLGSMVQQELNNSNAEIREVAQEAFEDIKMEVPYSLNQSEKIPVFGAQNSHSLQIDNMNKQPVGSSLKQVNESVSSTLKGIGSQEEPSKETFFKK